ncbi:MAG TPA: VOC family protein [Steroidobacteraceae bacterium]
MASNGLSHFAIHADNVERAKKFYGIVFHWEFRDIGADEFCQIALRDGGPAPIGAIQSRRFNALDKDLYGFECSFSVEDIDATARAVEAAGGAIVMRRTAIPNVGWIIKFRDTEGNLACAVQYDATAK